MKIIQSYDHGKVFPTAAVFGGYMLAAFAFFFLFTDELIGFMVAFFVLCIGLYAAFTRSGWEVDKEKNLFRSYTQYVWIKTGKWMDLTKFPYVSVLRTRYSSTSFSRSNRQLNQQDVNYEVYLLSPSHRVKILALRFDDKEKAREGALKLQNELELKWVKYNPR